MKPKIIETNNLSKELPKFRTWYELPGNVVFVSVIYPENSKTKSHFRRKNKPKIDKNKKDNDMCLWHIDWQYFKIEKQYGIEKNKHKTYEIAIDYEGHKFRVDSVVKNISIEFQHTLEVSVSEMNTRYKAQKTFGFNPYLILDFTEFSTVNSICQIDNFDIRKVEEYLKKYSNNNHLQKFLKRIKKWDSSEYFINKNLFIDFKDYIVRLNPDGLNQLYSYEKSFFVKNLVQIDQILEDSEIKTKNLIERKEKEAILKKEMRLKKENETKIKENKELRKESFDYKYYRKCIKNKHIKRAISSKIDLNDIDYVSHICFENEYVGINRKFHIYRLYKDIDSKSAIIEIQYIIEGDYSNNKFQFYKSTINIIKSLYEENSSIRGNIGIKRLCLEQMPKKPIKIKFIRDEIVKDYLHSFEGYAQIKYDGNNNISKKEYYIFNQKVDESTFGELSDHYNNFLDFECNQKSKKFIEDIHNKYVSNTDLFIKYVLYDESPHYDLFKNYYMDINEPVPLHDDF